MYQNPPRKDDTKSGSRGRKSRVRNRVQCSQGSRLSGTPGGWRQWYCPGPSGHWLCFLPSGCRRGRNLVDPESDLGIKKAECLSMSHTVWLALSFRAKVYIRQETPATVYTMRKPEARRSPVGIFYICSCSELCILGAWWSACSPRHHHS